MYFKPIGNTSILKKTSNQPQTYIKNIQRNTVFIKINNWDSDERYSAKILNVLGELVVSPAISQNSIMKWYTENSASGVYFLKIETVNRMINTQITVK